MYISISYNIDCDIGDLYLSYILFVYSDCVYDIGRFIVYLSYILFVYFFVGEWGRWVVYLVSVYLVCVHRNT